MIDASWPVSTSVRLLRVAAVEWWNDAARAGTEGIDQMLIGQQMIKRQGTMQDLANLCLFLCSDDAGFVTAQTILVDGGYTKKPY